MSGRLRGWSGATFSDRFGRLCRLLGHSGERRAVWTPRVSHDLAAGVVHADFRTRVSARSTCRGGQGVFGEPDKSELVSASVYFHALVRGFAPAPSLAAPPVRLGATLARGSIQATNGRFDPETGAVLNILLNIVREYVKIIK
jgi:hypothetical protein